ncbi:hypothetical protein MRX96_030789 [Rhipicephalus microplus]
MERCASASRAGKFHSVHRFGKKRKKSLIANTTKRRAAPAASVEDGRSSAPSIAAAEPAGVGLTAPPACESASGSGRVRIDTKILQPAELHKNARNAEAKLQELASISATTRKQDRLAAASDGAAADSADNVSFVVISLDCVNDLLSVHQLLRSSGMANASTGANPIWNFFVKVPPGQEAQCLKCHSILKTSKGTTTTLATHLKRHPDVFVTYEKERCARKSVKSTAKPDVQQPSVADQFKPKLKHTAPKAQQMTKAITGFTVRGMHSYSVVEEPGFVAVMNAAMPEDVVPSWTTFFRAIIPELYASKKQNLMNRLQAKWQMPEMADAHTAENLVLFLKSVMEEWALPDPGTVPVYVVTHNGRSFTAAITQSPWIGIKCFGHTLQLCVSDVKRDVLRFSQLCTKARAIIGRYKKSSKAWERLVEVQREMQLNVLEVVQDIPTRWNSEHQMMTRLLKLRKPITVELSECDAVDNLTAAEWKLMTAAVKVLDPLAQARTELSGDKYPTLSQVTSLLECTAIVLAWHTAQSDESSAIASSLARSIKARFPGVKTSEDTALGMFLDPRFKDACYMERAEKWACAILTKAAEGTLQVFGCEASTESDTG